MRVKDNRNLSLNFGVLVVTSILIGLGFMFMPLFNDDAAYNIPWRNMLEGGVLDIGATARECIQNHYNLDTARICNILMVFNVFIPHWLFQLVSTLAVGFILWIGAKMGGFMRSPARFTLWTALFVFAFPWIDQLYLIDFQLNYLWSTAMSLWLLYLVLSHKGKAAWMFLFGLFAGLWHEGFGGSMICAVGALLILFPEYRTRRTFAVLFGLIIGVVYVYLPRIGDAARNSYAGREGILYPFLLPTIFFFVLWIWRTVKGHTKFLLPLPTALAIIALSAMGLMLHIPVGPRTCAFGLTTSLIGIAMYMPSCHYPVLRKIFTIATLTLVAVHLIVVDKICFISGRETSHVIEEYRKTPQNTIFSSLPLRTESPLMALQKPYYEWFVHSDNNDVMTALYGINGQRIKVAPLNLKNFDEKNATPLAGTADVYVYENRLVRLEKGNGDEEATELLTVDYGNGPTARTFYTVPIKTNADGTIWKWLHPNQSTVNDFLRRKPIRIDSL